MDPFDIPPLMEMEEPQLRSCWLFSYWEISIQSVERSSLKPFELRKDLHLIRTLKHDHLEAIWGHLVGFRSVFSLSADPTVDMRPILPQRCKSQRRYKLKKTLVVGVRPGILPRYYQARNIDIAQAQSVRNYWFEDLEGTLNFLIHGQPGNAEVRHNRLWNNETLFQRLSLCKFRLSTIVGRGFQQAIWSKKPRAAQRERNIPSHGDGRIGKRHVRQGAKPYPSCSTTGIWTKGGDLHRSKDRKTTNGMGQGKHVESGSAEHQCPETQLTGMRQRLSVREWCDHRSPLIDIFRLPLCTENMW